MQNHGALASDLIDLLHEGARVAPAPATRAHLTEMADMFSGFMRDFAEQFRRGPARRSA